MTSSGRTYFLANARCIGPVAGDEVVRRGNRLLVFFKQKVVFLPVLAETSLGTQMRSTLRNRRDLAEQITLAPTEFTLVLKFMGAFLGDVLARRIPVSAFCRYRVSLLRKKCGQKIVGFNHES